jgi:hypothetical protein
LKTFASNDDEEELEIDLNDEDIREKQQSFNLVGKFLHN